MTRNTLLVEDPNIGQFPWVLVIFDLELTFLVESKQSGWHERSGVFATLRGDYQLPQT